MRLIVRLLAAALLTALALSAQSLSVLAGETRISLVLICDIYDMHEEGGRGGMARVGAVVKTEKARGPNVLVAHAGDTFSPSLMSGFDQGAHMVDLLNMLPIDVFVPGNHEYDFGPDVFLKRLREAHFPVYAANLREGDGSPIPGIIDSRIHAFGEVKIGVIGLTAEDSHKKSQPGRFKIAPMLDTAAALAASLRRQGADLIVLVSHSNRAIDNELVDSGVADVILSGDDHDLYLRYNGQVAIVEAAMDGLVVAVVDLSVKVDTLPGGKRKVAWWPRFRIIDTADVTPDPDVAARVAVYESRLSKSLDIVIGRTTTELDSRNAAVRGGEAAIGNLFTDALRTATGADVALLNGGGFRGNHVYPAGSAITERLVLAELPFLNRALVLEVSGKALRAAIEAGLAGAENEVGRFPQVSGMTIRADLTRPNGDRVVSLVVGGAPVEPDRLYKLATNDFLARGGDGYSALVGARAIVGPTDALLVSRHVIDHIKKLGTVSARTEGRIIVGRQRAPR
ncbi:MAG: bifunctional UDP-sugar hydrolase/5'-nucleotidase [Reyranellaceae bacterium]